MVQDTILIDGRGTNLATCPSCVRGSQINGFGPMRRSATTRYTRPRRVLNAMTVLWLCALTSYNLSVPLGFYGLYTQDTNCAPQSGTTPITFVYHDPWIERPRLP